MKIRRFEEIQAWQEARELVNSIYRVCSVDAFKNDFSLIDQTKRSSVSIMANIAEGFARQSKKEFVQFLFIAKSSAAETQNHIYIALDQGYLSKEKFEELYDKLDKIQRQISNFIKYLRSEIQRP